MYNASIDKIRIKCKYRNNKVLGLGNTPYIYDALVGKYAVPSWVEYTTEPTESLARYKYRWSVSLRVVGEKEGVLWCGLGYNDSITQENLICVEFNPNKTGIRIWEWLQYTFNLEVVEIANCDLAFDIPNVCTTAVSIKTTADVMTYGSNTNRTTYIAPKGDNRIKIYQKDVERSIMGVDMAKTLRIEISLAGVWLSRYNLYNADTSKITAIVERLNSVSWVVDTDTTDATLYLLLNSSEDVRNTALSLMSSATKAKYRKLLATHSATLNLDTISFADIVYKLLKPYTRGIKIK